MKFINLKSIQITTILIIGLLDFSTIGQTLKVLNIPDNLGRANSGIGYTLNTSLMVNHALPKLTNAVNFGSLGTIPYSLTFDSLFGTTNSITNISQLNPYDIIFIGGFFTSSAFSATELQIIKDWSLQPRKVLIVGGQANHPVAVSMGYSSSNGSTSSSYGVVGDIQSSVKIFSGPFGTTSLISQGGSALSRFGFNCTSIALARDGNGAVTMLYDPKHRDVILSDIDFFTSLNSSMQADNTINTNAEIAWGNLWAWAVREAVAGETPPTTLYIGGNLSVVSALPLCSTGNITTIQNKNFGGNIIEWQTSTNGGITWNNISSSTNILLYPNATNGQMFRSLVQSSDGCTVSTSNTVITTTSTLGCSVVPTGSGNIDCNKIQISPFPTFGVPSQIDLIITINVTTPGTFTPITVNGAGLSLSNNISTISSVSSSSVGIQTFHIPLKYDGTSPLESFNFTIGSAGTCTLDLSIPSKNVIENVWTLECIPIYGPVLK